MTPGTGDSSVILANGSGFGPYEIRAVTLS